MTHDLSRARRAALSAAAAAACLCAHAQTPSSTPALPATEVTATRFADSAETLPAAVSVITADDIRASGATSVNDAIVRLLGVPGRADFHGAGDFSLDLRGFGSTADSNQVIVVDGIRLSEQDQSGTRLAGIAIDTVERIEVLRGSSAVLYGEGATGGVIVITTKGGAGVARKNSATVYAGAGSHGLRDVRASGTVASGGFSLDVSGQKRNADNFRDNARAEFENATLAAQWSGDQLRLGFRHSRDALDSRLPGALSAAQYAADPRQSVNPTHWGSIDNERTSVFAEYSVGSWQLAAEAASRGKTVRSFQGFNYDYDVDARNYALRARNESRLGGARNVFVAGVDRNEWSRVDNFGATGTHASTGVYLKDDITLVGGTRLSAGVRSEQIRKRLDDGFSVVDLDRTQNAWELGISQPLSAQATAWARVGTSFRLANIDDLFGLGPTTLLRPQTSRDLEGGLRWSASGVKLEARAYRNALTDEIGFDPTAFANVNYDRTRRQGVEFDARWTMTAHLALRANLGLREATFREGPFTGRDVPLVPKRTVAVRADWTPAAQHRVSGGVTWVSSQSPRVDQQCRMPAYAIADVRYAYQWNNVELALGVGNLFDKNYYSLAYGCTAATGGAPTSLYPEAGRTVTASMRVSF